MHLAVDQTDYVLRRFESCPAHKINEHDEKHGATIILQLAGGIQKRVRGPIQ